MKPSDPGNDWLKFWSENQKSLFQTWAEGKPPPFASMGQQPAGGNAIADLMQRSMEQWTTYATQAWAERGRFDAEAMKKLFDPVEWKRAGSHFDMGFEKLMEGPTYATLWDLDRKMLNVQKLWIERGRDAERYWEVVQGAWNRALELFTKALNDGKAEPITSGRQMLDLWLATANKALVEMHRSPEFLEAQRRITRSTTEYRLAEREIAENFCEVHHIPTRTEMDEAQKAVTELKREVRALRRERRDDAQPAAAATKAPSTKPVPGRRAATAPRKKISSRKKSER